VKRIWSKLPSRGIREGALRAVGPDGGAAALKLYMALALWANFKPSPSAEVAGLARLTYSELEALCDISRRYVSRASRSWPRRNSSAFNASERRTGTCSRALRNRAGPNYRALTCSRSDGFKVRIPLKVTDRSAGT
jgi:hypothetical protein